MFNKRIHYNASSRGFKLDPPLDCSCCLFHTHSDQVLIVCPYLALGGQKDDEYLSGVENGVSLFVGILTPPQQPRDCTEQSVCCSQPRYR